MICSCCRQNKFLIVSRLDLIRILQANDVRIVSVEAGMKHPMDNFLSLIIIFFVKWAAFPIRIKIF